jgi:putative FmdB family regulatory protein
MPTYEYRCPSGHDFEHFVLKISAAASVLPCPTCGAEAPRRMSAGGGLLFKGSGFYITDYGKDGKKDQRAAAAKTDAAAPAKSDAAASPAPAGSPAATGSASSSGSSSGSSSSATGGSSSGSAS